MNIIDQGKELMRVDNRPSASSDLLNRLCEKMEKCEREKNERQKKRKKLR